LLPEGKVPRVDDNVRASEKFQDALKKSSLPRLKHLAPFWFSVRCRELRGMAGDVSN
jgi:hypothetical protein